MNKTTLSLLFVFTALLSNAQILNEDSNQPVKSIGEIVSTDTLVMRSTTSSAGNLTENLVTSYNFAPSPEAHALMQYSDIPVSLYTGVPEISIPIYTISVGDYNLPLKLQYHASGIKVSQEASRVGLGCSEQAVLYYTKASYMCPNRFAPLEGLYNAYDAMGDKMNKSRIADMIAKKRIKVLSADVIRIKDLCR